MTYTPKTATESDGGSWPGRRGLPLKCAGARSILLPSKIFHIFCARSELHGLELPVDVVELEDLPDEEVSVAPVHLRVSDVDHVLVDVEVHLE